MKNYLTIILLLVMLPLMGQAQSGDQPRMRLVMFYAEEEMPPPGYCDTAVEFETKIFPGNVASSIFSKAGNAIMKAKEKQHEGRNYQADYVYLNPGEYAVIFSVKYAMCDGTKKKYYLIDLKDSNMVQQKIKRQIESSLMRDDYVSHKIEYMEQPFQVEEPDFWESLMHGMKKFMEFLNSDEQKKVQEDIQNQRSAGVGKRG